MDRRPWVTVGLLAAAAAAAAVWFWNTSTIYTDDAFIYLSVARNWAEGFGPVLNPGDSHTPVTGLGWAGLVAILISLGPASVPLAVKTLTTVVVFFSGLLLALVVKRTPLATPLVLPCAIVSVELFRFTVGLEIHLALLLSISALYLAFSLNRLDWAAAVIGIGFFARGDVLLLAPCLAGIWIWEQSVRHRTNARQISRSLLIALGIGLAVLTTGMLLSHYLTGSYLPVTMSAKVIQGKVGPWNTFGSQWTSHVLGGLGGWWLMAPFAAIGFARLGRIGATLGLFAVVQGSAYTVLQVAHYPWYGWITQAVVRIALCSGIAWTTAVIVNRATRTRPGELMRAVAPVTLAVVVMTTLSVDKYELTEREDLPAVGTANHLTVFLEAAKFIRSEVCGSGNQGRSIVLAPAIGILSFYADCAVYRDVNGLASPGLTPENLNNWAFWIETYSPDALVRRRYPGKQNRPIRFTAPISGSISVYRVGLDSEDRGYRISVYLDDSD